MPIINGVEYNDVLWDVAGNILALPFAQIPGVTEVYMPEVSEEKIRAYNKLVAKLKRDFKKRKIPFDEGNFRPAGTIAPNIINISFIPKFR
jgi:hypothetical protein